MTIQDLEVIAEKARGANNIATCTVVGVARALVMCAREGHNTADSLASLAEAVDAQREAEQALLLARTALMAAITESGMVKP